MVVVAAMGTGAFGVRIQIYTDVQGAEAAGFFVAFTDGFQLGLKIKVLNVGEVTASEATHTGDTTGTVGDPLAHAWTCGHSKVCVVIELRIDGAGVDHGEVTPIAIGRTSGIRRAYWMLCVAGVGRTVVKLGAGSGSGM